jgi:isopenicillin N synthase-like dioxygenase
MTVVPLIDLTPWYTGGAAGRRQVATAVDAALCEVGFLLLTGHPVDPGLAQRVRRAGRVFFDRTVQLKAEVACFPGGRGWTPPPPPERAVPGRTPALPDPRESFAFGPEMVPPAVAGTPEEEWFGPNDWPADLPELRVSATAWRRSCAQLTEDLLRVCALALDLAEDYFVSRCAGGTWRAGLVRHGPWQVAGPVRSGPVRFDPETDAGVLTLLDRRPGTGCLQVRALDGAWVDVPQVPGALTLNAGDLLARWTGDRWRSAPHRVLPPSPGGPGEEALSLVSASGADPLAVVGTLPTAAAGPARYAPVTAGTFLRGRTETLAVG